MASSWAPTGLALCPCLLSLSCAARGATLLENRMGLRFVNFKLRNRKIQITHHVHKQNQNKNRKDRIKITNTHLTPMSALISRHFHHILKNLLKNPSTQTRPEFTASTFANYRHIFQ